MPLAVHEVSAALSRDGYYVTWVPVPIEEQIPFVLRTARSLGDLYVPPDCDPEEPVIRTAPTQEPEAAPFDRPEAIGWHGDFATHPDRPQLSLVYVTRPDPRGGDFGAWRLASVAKVLAALQETASGRAAFDLLSRERLPFSYDDEQPTERYRVIEDRPEGIPGLRLYVPSIRRGCMIEYGKVPDPVAAALELLEAAADRVQEVVPTRSGSLLITSNWFALHDRVQQTVNDDGPNREAMLCFVSQQQMSTP